MATKSLTGHVIDALTVLWEDDAKVSLPLWNHTEPMARAVLAAVESLPGLDPHLQVFRRAPLHPLARRALEAALDATELHPAENAVKAFLANGAVFPRLGARYHEPHEPVALPEPAPRVPLDVDSGTWDITVVVDFRALPGHYGRLRNALASLRALADQTLDRERYRVVVVEQDSSPRHQNAVAGLADAYVHVRHDGPYNRSWAHNAGAARVRGRGRHLAFLDADMLLEKGFLDRARRALLGTGAAAMLPYERVIYLNGPSSDRAVDQRLGPLGTVDPGRLHGYHLTPTFGGCLFVATELFDRLGGYDERFEGWGEEDNDFFYRVEAATRVAGLPVDLHHLDHERPAMPGVAAEQHRHAKGT
ncbi:MAG: hypothetical protein QOF58_4509 [Pseudonocardiales bacterium]|jgi:hypothetical protein|nr:hypothetical protein [Pseudonocardiales bacterium]